MLRFILLLAFSCFSFSSYAASSGPNSTPSSTASLSTKTVKNEPLPDKMELSLAEKNSTSSMQFLEDNKKKPDIHTLPSGLQYKIIEEGNGVSPGPTDFVIVNYRGTLIEGTEFENSYTRQAPATFAVNAVIPGWSEALQLMKPGSKWTVYVPPQLAYGEQGAGRLIGPNAALIFDIELVAIKPIDENLDESLEEINEEG